MSRPKGIAILLPSSGRRVHIRWSIALGQLMAAPPVGQNIFVFTNEPDPEKAQRGEFTRSEQREQLVEAALKVNPEFLLWIDDDTVPPPTALIELFYVMCQNPKAAIVGGIYCTKTLPPQPIVFMDYGAGPYWEWMLGDIFECKGLGTGCMLVRADVMNKIPKPWFKDTSEANLNDVENINGQDVGITSRSGTDDIYFCKKVSDAGFPIIAHGGVLPTHLDYNTEPVMIYKLPKNSYPVEMYQRKLDEENDARAAKGLKPVTLLSGDKKVVL